MDAQSDSKPSRSDNTVLLAAIGARVRTERAKRGMTRRALAEQCQTSDRYLAQIEGGAGNPSVLVLDAIARALGLDPIDLLPGGAALRGLRRLPPAQLTALMRAAEKRNRGTAQRARRIALIGLRGAGKSTLGRSLADALDLPFVELSREVERIAGCSIREIHDLYGSNAYRRYERRALDEVVRLHAEAVIATPGGIVAEPATFDALLGHCTTVWLQASAEEHMARVAAQGDTRPMAQSREAMADLRRILAGRAAFYAKADAALDTSGKSEDESLAALVALAGQLLGDSSSHEVKFISRLTA